ncbi:MAG: trypsin-like peptidase domain-containing protein [Pseudonocardia sp.]
MVIRRAVEVYADWPDHPLDEGRWRCGSGYLLAARLVLTAAHVVAPDHRPLSKVRIRAEGSDLVDAEVRWHRWEDGVDVALVEITDPRWAEPTWPHPVWWGRLVTTRPGLSCEAIGFPSVVATPRMRDSHQARGVLNPGSLVKSGLYAVE